MPTPHIEAKQGEIAETIFLPGDPLRAKYMAENYLTEPVLFNRVRNMFGYTGYYKGQRVSVMGTGMGAPSISIYVHELISHYGVQNLIRVGSCGSIQEEINLGSVLICDAASTNSAHQDQYLHHGVLSATPDFFLLRKAVEAAERMNIDYKIAHLLTSDLFYHEDPQYWQEWARVGVHALEMESYALYTIAKRHKRKALTICTVSDSLITKEEMNDRQREKGMGEMLSLALESVLH
jgi:purine-nucleoside phosphorylase